MLIPLKGAGSGGVQQKDDVGIVVADRIQLVDPGIVGVVHVRLALVTGGEAPAAIPAAVRLLPVAVANLAALHRDTVLPTSVAWTNSMAISASFRLISIILTS